MIHDASNWEEKKNQAVVEEDFDRALEFRQKEIQAHKKIAGLKEKLKEQSLNNPGKLTGKEISIIISKITGIPMNDIVTEERKQFLNLEKILGSKIIGQKEAIKTISEFIRRARAGISDSKRPTGSFMLLGPSGVGKT